MAKLKYVAPILSVHYLDLDIILVMSSDSPPDEPPDFMLNSFEKQPFNNQPFDNQRPEGFKSNPFE